MMAIERAKNLCIDFCSLIENPSNANKVKIKNLLKFLDETVDQHYEGSLDNVAELVEQEIDEIWRQLSKGDRSNFDLRDLYVEIQETLVNHYQESNSSTFSDYYSENSNFDIEEEEGEGDDENEEEE